MTGAPKTEPTAPTDGERLAYYGGALLALRFFEGRRPTGRRFGADADARWRDFAGELDAGDRIDLLIRDADLEWSGAIGARAAFALDGVADDDAFGAAWERLPPAVADELWRAQQGGPIASIKQLIDALFAQHRRTFVPVQLVPVGPTHRLLVAGPSAIASTILAFEGKTDLDFGQQISLVASTPFARQLGALGPALLATGTASRFVTAGDGPFSATYVGADASAEERDLFGSLTSGARP